MKIAVIYNYPTANFGPQHARLAERFVTTYRDNPPMMDHMMVVVSNGGPPNGQAISQFSFIEGTKFIQRENEGWDIGAYQFAAKHLLCDMMFCCGGPCYFKKAGWLRRMVEAWKEYGPGMYGTLATYEHGPFWRNGATNPHINTTGFAVHPHLIQAYPKTVITREDRYEFEHGAQSLWRLTASKGFPVKLVTWSGVYPVERWREPVNGYRSGDQSDCMTFWSHTDEYDSASPDVKARMKNASDGK